MKIYLDIDGVLLTKDGQPAPDVIPFIKYVTTNFDTYWLTTHCRHGETESVLQHLSWKLPQEVQEDLKTIKPVVWDVLKTEAIDFSSDFRWFDDYLMESEKAVLERHNALDKLILVDLRSNPSTLRETIQTL